MIMTGVIVVMQILIMTNKIIDQSLKSQNVEFAAAIMFFCLLILQAILACTDSHHYYPGVTLDQELSLSHPVNLITRGYYYENRQLRAVMRSLSLDASLTLVHVFVTSRIAQCCSVLASLPSRLIWSLDKVLRSRAVRRRRQFLTFIL